MVSLLDRISTREVKRADAVDSVEFGRLLGLANGSTVRTKAGTFVGPHRALGITAWYSGARYISETVSMLPWHHYMKSVLGRDQRAPWPWLEKPDVEQTWAGWAEHQVMSLLHKGNGFSFKLRNLSDQVVGLRELHPDRITGGCAPDGTKRFMVDHDPTPYTTRDILHIPGLAYSGRLGLNPIATLADALGTVAAADDYAGRWFSSSTHMGGIISMPGDLTATQAKDLREVWDAFHAGLLNAHKTGVLSNGAKYDRITLSAADSQLLESRQYGIQEISRILRIPPHKLYDLSRSTNNNIEQQSIESVTDSIRPWVQRIENAINDDADLVMPGHYLEASLEGVLRGDSVARAAFYTSGINAGWMMPSTPARLENLPAPPELDYYLRPLNMDFITPGVDKAADAATPEAIALMIQKLYLGVGIVLSAEEARDLIHQAGGTLSGPLPPKVGGAE